MKRALLLIIVSLNVIIVSANPVSFEAAQRVAENFAISQGIQVKDYPVVDVAPEHLFHQLYVFGFQGTKGFVVVSADDRVLPILGYSLTNIFSPVNIPDHVKEWYLDYEAQIDSLVVHNVEPTDMVRQEWNSYINPEHSIMRSMAATVSPLITTTWNQSPYYNNLCPTKNGSLTVTGCVATATAQVMKYWNHPTTGRGSHSYSWNGRTLSANFGTTTYQWSNMPTSLTAATTSTKKNAVATLMYHIGVAIEMEYGLASEGGSAAMTSSQIFTEANAASALQTYFKYSNNIRTLHYSDMTDAEWKSIMKTELNAGRVMLYDGRDPSGGHCFICDGYNSSSYFHFNWGWGGSYDGYYAIGNLHPGSGGTGGNSSYTFNLNNSIVIGIQPITGTIPSNTTVTGSTSNSTRGTVSGSGSYSQYNIITLLATAKNGYIFDHWNDNDKANPRYSIATSSTFRRTAYFVPLPTDSICYCNNEWYSAYSGSGTTQWGIRYPANILAANKTLTDVKVILYESGRYTLKVYQGDGSLMTQVYSQQFTPAASLGWETIHLSTPYQIDNTKSLWITLSYTGSGYPMVFSSFYGGTVDGMKYKNGSSWTSYPEAYSAYGSWCIKGVLGTSTTPVSYTLTTKAAPSNMGYTSPTSSTVTSGTNVTVTASAYTNYKFLCWSDYGTPKDYKRTVNVTSDKTLTALFGSIESNGTVGYCYQDYVSAVGQSSSNPIYWGVKFASGSPLQDKALVSISYYCNKTNSGEITAYIYKGGSSAPQTLVSQFSFTPAATVGWQTFSLPAPVWCGSSIIWIVLSGTGSEYPCTYTKYSANSNGSYVSTDGGSSYHSILNDGYTATWMIQAHVRSFQTEPVSLPYTCTFEATQDNTKWEIGNNGNGNTFVIGNATNNGGTRALYVSNDNSSYNYTSNNSQAYARILVPMPAGKYVVSYDYKCIGEPYANDYGRVLFYPAVNETGCISALDTTTPAGNLTVSPTVMVNVPSWTHVAYEIEVPAYNLYYFQANWLDNDSVSNTYGLAIDNISIYEGEFEKYHFEESDSICQGESYNWHSMELTASGIYYDSLTTIYDKDSIYQLTLTVHPSYSFETSDTICFGTSYRWRERELTESGIYFDSIVSQYGCDSVYKLSLVVHPSYLHEETQNICQESSYIWREQTFTESGVYYDSLHTQAGCDSVYKLTLTVNPIYFYEETHTICQGETYYWHNRSLTAAGVYYDSLLTGSGCDSVHRLTLMVNPTYFNEEIHTICQGETYNWHNKTLTAAGVYYDSLTTLVGCDSVNQLTLEVNPSFIISEAYSICVGEAYNWHNKVLTVGGVYYDSLTTVDGCDSIYELTLTVNPTYFIQEAHAICNGETYIWHNRSLTDAGVSYDSLTTSLGCDSVYELTLTVNPTYFYQEDHTICQGQTYSWHNRLLSFAGVYYDSLTTVDGCDSVYELTLTVNPTYFIQEYHSVCVGEVYTWHGKTLDLPGIYYDSLLTAAGCDSTYQLIFNVNPEYFFADTAMTCQGSPYSWRGKILTDAGEYYDSLVTTTGCDSVFKLVLDVPQSHYVYESNTICQGETYNWHGKMLNTSGVYYDSLTTIAGCDSVYELTLTVNPTYFIQEYHSVCVGEVYTWHGKTLVMPGIYYDSLLTAAGCDSIYHLIFNVNPEYLFVDTAMTCQGSPYSWRGKILTDASEYYDSLVTTTGCDSVYKLVLNVPQPHCVYESNAICQGETYNWHGRMLNTSGVYYDSLISHLGCDSIYELTLTVNPIFFFTESDVICHGDAYNWHGKAITSAGVYYDSLLTSAGCDSIYELTLTTNSYTVTVNENDANAGKAYCNINNTKVQSAVVECGETAELYTEAFKYYRFVEWSDGNIDSMRIITVKSDTNLIAKFEPNCGEWAEWPVIFKYNSLFILDIDSIQSMGYDPQPEDVSWWKVVGEPDDLDVPFPVNDQFVCNGIYMSLITNNLSYGQYYAVVDVSKESNTLCSDKMRTEIVEYSYNGQRIRVELAPTNVKNGDVMTVSGLVPDEETTIKVYDYSGKLIETIKSSGSERCQITATGAAGVYMVNVVSDSVNETVKFIVTE